MPENGRFIVYALAESAARRGRKHSPETRAKMAESAAKAWIKRSAR